MAFRRGVEAVDGFGGDEKRSVKTKSDLGGREVVIDRLGHSYDF